MTKKLKVMIILLLALTFAILFITPARIESVAYRGNSGSFGGIPACCCPCPANCNCYCVWPN